MKFIFRIFLFLLLLSVTDFTLGRLFHKFYLSSQYGIFARQIYCLNDSREDIIVLGASRAAHHYVPSILSDSLGMSCYNAGSDGMCIYYHYGILSSYMKERKPKIVLYDVSELDLLPSRTATFTLEAALDRLAPHYRKYAEIDSLYALAGWQEKLKMYSRMYRYNSKLVQLIKCHYIPSQEDAGYEALYGNLPKNTKLSFTNTPDNRFEYNKKQYLNKLVRLTQAEGIELIFIHSPQYSNDRSAAIDEIKEIAQNNHILFLDFSHTPELMSPSFFKDKRHLNDTGARKFSALLANTLLNESSAANL